MFSFKRSLFSLFLGRYWDILPSATDGSIVHLSRLFFGFGMADGPGAVFVAFHCMMMACVFFCRTCSSTTFSFALVCARARSSHVTHIHFTWVPELHFRNETE